MTLASREEHAGWAEDVEMAAWRDFYAAAPAEVAVELGVRAIDLADGLALVAPGARTTLYNRVLGIGTRHPVDDRTLQEIRDVYASGPRSYVIHLAPPAARQPLEWWAERGFHRRRDVAKLVRDVDAPAPEVHTELRIELVGAEYAQTVAEIVHAVWPDPPSSNGWLAAMVGRPRWSHYLAYDGDQPIATGAMFIDGAVGWEGWDVTLPEHRGRGTQTAILARRVEDAAALGCRRLTGDTSQDLPSAPNPSYRNVIRNGFTLDYLRPVLFPTTEA
jgi:GNAT superfamily N-acetyltransferase